MEIKNIEELDYLQEAAIYLSGIATGMSYRRICTYVRVQSLCICRSEMQPFILELQNVATGSKDKGMFAGPICGASMNPARSPGPANVSGHNEYLWIYLTAIVIGAVAAVPIWKYL